MQEIDGVKIPDEHIAFAEGVAALADQYGMDRVTLKYRPEWSRDISLPRNGVDRRINGDMEIIYSSVDGRGRPCRKLHICCSATMALSIAG